jgi:hypothetical protein
MSNKEPKTTSSRSSKQRLSKIGNLREYVKLCAENKISQLNLPDGTVIQMSPLAYYDDKSMNFAPSQTEIPTTKAEDIDTMDEDILFASAR